MRWRRPHSKRSGGTTTEQTWSDEDTALVRQAVARAPSVLTPPPWTLEFGDRTAALYRHADQEQRRQDPEGRDRDLSCGAALTNLVLAIRYTGWAVEVHQNDVAEPDASGERHGALAVVTRTHRQAPSSAEGQRFRAMPRQHNHRRPFDPEQLTHVSRQALESAARQPTVWPNWLSHSQAERLAALLARTARHHRRDHHFYRELAMWTSSRHPPDEGPWAGPSNEDPDAEAPPDTPSAMPRLPDTETLAAWIAVESVLCLSTPSDTHEERVHAGSAMQQAWLTATSLGLVASAITRPLHLDRFRSALHEELGLPGNPQVLLRFGNATVVPGQRRA